MLYHLVHRMPRAGTDEVIQFLARPVCAAMIRRGGYGEAAPKSLVAMSAAAVNATPSTTKVGFLRGLKDYDCSQSLSSITAKTTIISGGADRLTPMRHARELADGIPGATLIHQHTAGHTLLHEIPQVVTGAISSAIATRGPANAPGNQVSRAAPSDAVARVLDHSDSGAYGPGGPEMSDKPIGGDFGIDVEQSIAH